MASYKRQSFILGIFLVIFIFSIPKGISSQALTTSDPLGCEGLPPVECDARQEKCAVSSSLLSGTGGPMGALFTCATKVNVSKTLIYPNIGKAFSSGHPESIVEMITNDTDTLRAMRACMLTSAGLLGVNGTLDTEALATKIQSSVDWNPPLAAILSDAARICPQPTDLKYMEYLACVQAECISNISVAVFSYTKPPPGDGGKKAGDGGKKASDGETGKSTGKAGGKSAGKAGKSAGKSGKSTGKAGSKSAKTD